MDVRIGPEEIPGRIDIDRNTITLYPNNRIEVTIRTTHKSLKGMEQDELEEFVIEALRTCLPTF